MKTYYQDGFADNVRSAELPSPLGTSLVWLISAAALLWAGLGILGL